MEWGLSPGSVPHASGAQSSMSSTHTIGSSIWVLDGPSGQQDWIKASVTKVEADKLTVRTENGDTRVCKPDGCPLQNPPSRGGVEVRVQCCKRCANEDARWPAYSGACTHCTQPLKLLLAGACIGQAANRLGSRVHAPLAVHAGPIRELANTPPARCRHCGSLGRARYPPESVLEKQLL